MSWSRGGSTFFQRMSWLCGAPALGACPGASPPTPCVQCDTHECCIGHQSDWGARHCRREQIAAGDGIEFTCSAQCAAATQTIVMRRCQWGAPDESLTEVIEREGMVNETVFVHTGPFHPQWDAVMKACAVRHADWYAKCAVPAKNVPTLPAESTTPIAATTTITTATPTPCSTVIENMRITKAAVRARALLNGSMPRPMPGGTRRETLRHTEHCC